LSNG